MHSSDFDGADRVGTIYIVKTNFKNLTANLTIAYDGDADPAQFLRSPDNLDWADDGMIYIQEDKAVDDLFGYAVANTSEAGVVRLNPKNHKMERIANIDRSVILDASIDDPEDAVDVDSAEVGEWESSGIVDVSGLFDSTPGSMFLLDVQAHGIEDQDTKGNDPDSRITDDDLVEGGQLLILLQGIGD